MEGSREAAGGRRTLATRGRVLALLIVLAVALAVALALETLAVLETPRTNTSSPPPLADAAMAYDPVAGHVLLFGGASGDPRVYHDATWAFANGSWEELRPAHTPPGANLVLLTYDAADGYVLLYESRDLAVGQTWAFANGDWTNLSSRSAPPDIRSAATLAYDAADGYAVLQGTGPSDWILGRTWTFVAGQWTNRTSGPAPNGSGLMAWDPALDSIVYVETGYYTFLNNSASYCNQTWTYRSGAWNHTQWPSPCGKTGAAMAYSSGGHEMVLYDGGGNACNAIPCNATWFLAGTAWTWKAVDPHPGLGSWAFGSMADDPPGQGVVLFGGGLLLPGTFSDATWLFSHGAWTNDTPAEVLAPQGLTPVLVATGIGAVIAVAGAVFVVRKRRRGDV